MEKTWRMRPFKRARQGYAKRPTKRAKSAKRESPVDKSNELVVWWIDQP